MSPEQHNKFLAWSHLAFSALYIFMGVVFGIAFMLMFIGMGSGHGDAPPAAVGVIFGLFFFFFYGVLNMPSLIAGYALLKHKSWAKVAAIIAGVMGGMQFPIGTAVCIYTFWFLFSEPGKQLYDQPARQLPPPPPHWSDQNAGARGAYVPRNPPDWR